MWRIAYEPETRVLSVQLRGDADATQCHALARAHVRALEATGGQVFKVFLDLRGLRPLEGEAISIVADMKRVAAALPGCDGVAVLADSPTVAMQQHRTRIHDGTDPGHELVTLDEVEAQRFLRTS